MYPNVHTNTINNNQDMETTYMSIKTEMVKWIIVLQEGGHDDYLKQEQSSMLCYIETA